jgi:outer membrane protein assembly factor BamB
VNTDRHSCRVACLAVSLLSWTLTHSAFAATDVTINARDVYPESITVANGAVIIGSYSKPFIYKAARGQSRAEPWIRLRTPGAGILGVLADEKSKTLWACDVGPESKSRHTVLRAFDLTTGDDKASYPLPGDSNLCNDIAIAADGSIFVSDTTNGAILRLRQNKPAFEVWQKHPLLEGVDGIAFLKGVLYVNSVSKNLLLRVPTKANGAAGVPVKIETSQPLVGPDGMRVQGGRMFVAENSAKRVSELKVKGDKATVTVIKEGFVTPTGIEPAGGVLWVCDSKFAYQDELKGQDPGEFKAYAVSLRK